MAALESLDEAKAVSQETWQQLVYRPKVNPQLHQLGVPRWIRLALPEDVEQEIALTFIEYPWLTPAARRQLVRHRLAVLRWEVWDRLIRGRPHTPHGLRPSKLRRRRGYRKHHHMEAL